MNLRPVSAALLLLLLPAAAEEPAALTEVKERAGKLMAAGKASEVKASDQEYGTEVMETLIFLLPADPEAAVRYFLKAREQVAADRKAGTESAAAGEQTEDMKRSASVLTAALSGAVSRTEHAVNDNDAKVPQIIAAVAEMLATDRGCAVEGCYSICQNMGGMVIMAGRTAENGGGFTVQRFVERMGPLVKPEWLPALLGPVRAAMWTTDTKNNEGAKTWLAKEAKEGTHRELAMLVLATARISHQEHDATNKERAGIMARADLPEEQQWLLAMMERKNAPPAMMASCALEILRDWTTAEPPLRYAGAKAMAVAWAAEVPVNESEADRIVERLSMLCTNGTPPGEEGYRAAVKVLAEAWATRVESGKPALYGWSRTGCGGRSGPLLVKLAEETKQDDVKQRIFQVMLKEAAKDETLRALVELADSFQGIKRHGEALQVIESLTEERVKGEKVPEELRIHIASKRVHLPIQLAGLTGGLDAAVKATVKVLTDRTDDPIAWAGSAWGWYNWGGELRTEGNHEEALRRFCVGCILARSAKFFAQKTHGKYLPPCESACRGELKALKLNPDNIKVFGTQNGVRMMLDEFGESWKPLSPAAMRRILDGAAME